VSVFADLPWLLPVIGAGICVLVAMVRFPKVWLGLFLLVLPFFLTDTGEGVSASEVAIGGLFTGAIALWMIWRLAVDPRPLVRGWTDFLLLLFIVAAFANIVVAASNHIPLGGWAVDWSYFLLMLYYFPFREEFGKDTATFRQFIALAGVSALSMALYSAWTFKQKMAENMIYAYQIQASRSATLGPLFLLMLCIGLVLVFHVKWRAKMVTLLIMVVNLAALLLTFTRTLWVLVFACSALAMLFLRWKQNTKIILGGLTILVVSVSVFYAISPKVASVALVFVQKRFTSSTQLKGGDFSFETRIIEVNDAWRKVKQAPLGGNGLRSMFVTWTPIDQWHNRTSFVHIGYIGLIHKVGFPTALIMFCVLIGFSIRSIRAALAARRPHAPPLARSVAIGVFAFIPAMYINIFMAGIFDQRYGNVMFAFIFAAVALSEEALRRAQQDPPLESQ
jgi:O-antigen ligase